MTLSEKWAAFVCGYVANQGNNLVHRKNIEIPTTAKPDCQYTLSALGVTDGRCAGCTHKSN